jgi:hypothetical protein
MSKGDKIRVKSYERKKAKGGLKTTKRADKLEPINRPIEVGTKIISRDQPPRKPGEGVTILGRHGEGVTRVPR